MTMDQHTPLFEAQKLLGAKFTSFGGWELPVSYSDILKEHQAVRTACGLFDVSHMGELLVTGNDALSFVNGLVTNDILPAPYGKAIYSPMCYENGTVVDDILVYKVAETTLLLILNAGNIQKDEEWIRSKAQGNVEIENLSPLYVELALQGPAAERVIAKLAQGQDLPGFFCFKEMEVLGMKVLISRTGYTGEDGFELYLNVQDRDADPVKLWNGLLEAGREDGLVPCGLGCRDTLRLEAALPLYGHELSDSITPLEAGLNKFVKLQKESFVGKEALAQQAAAGLKRRTYGFEMLDRGIPRNGYEVHKNGERIGYVTSGGPLPTLNQNGGIALLEGNPKPADIIEVLIRDRSCQAKIVELPFYGKKYKK
ncbi:MAG: glycine cleavage system aminomethyltransferase GcvT [Clostridia bacterium]|nr:glycine cleavage system aminomethyltransferase GcvT [Clostridia bacterium]